MEGNIFEGHIEVPIGKYSVIVMNESYTDSYWQGSEFDGTRGLAFENVDSYEDFAAYVKTHNNNPSGYYFESYEADGEHMFMMQPLRLSSWSLDDFEISEDMVAFTQKTRSLTLKSVDQEMYLALTRDDENDTDGLDMRKLTRDVEVTLRIKNLSSTSTIKGGITGFVNKVNMRSGNGFLVPADKTMLQYFTFNGRSNWVDDNGNSLGEDWQPTMGENNANYEDYTGETSAKFLSLGRNLVEGVYEDYLLDLDFLYITGSRLDKTTSFFNVTIEGGNETTSLQQVKLPFKVTPQITSVGSDYFELFQIDVSTVELEFKTGDITVEDWGDDNIIPL